jgi:hypothetical protein
VIGRFVVPVVASIALAAASQAYGHGTIDLDVAGNLEAIARDHPDRFAKIQQILAEVPRQPLSEAAVATWMRTEFQARDVRYTDLIMTSLPPKKRLQFSLDDTSYVKVITLAGWQAKAMPAVEGPRSK